MDEETDRIYLTASTHSYTTRENETHAEKGLRLTCRIPKNTTKYCRVGTNCGWILTS